MTATYETSSTTFGPDSTENEYGFPKFVLNSGITWEGARIIPFLGDVDPIDHAKQIRDLPVRHDDVYICAFPKCGTHWVWEVVLMLLNKNIQYSTKTKESVMLEYATLADLNSEPSPRVLNTHLFMAHMPQEVVSKKAKIIHLVRNPKDTAVSYFYHVKQYCKGNPKFENFMKLYMEGEMAFGHQFYFLEQFDEFLHQHPDHPVKLVYYEDMKLDPIKMIKELAEFLGVDASDSLCRQIASSCSFDNLKKVDESRKLPDHLTIASCQFYRKGIIGDWKNNFTVALNEIFDDFLAREIKKGVNYKFVYE